MFLKNKRFSTLKKVFLAILLVSLFKPSFSQDTKRYVFYTSVKSGYLSINNYSPRFTHGLQLDLNTKENINVHWSFFGRKDYLHLNAGPAVGIWTIKNNDVKEDSTSSLKNFGQNALAFIVFSLIPEGISYDFNIGEKMQLSPIVNPLGLEFIYKEDEDDTKMYVTLGLGSLLNYYFWDDKIKVTLHGEYRMHYNKKPNIGFFTGVSLGCRLVK